jgi:predicted Rossmann fold nucleotide-binding protein DprA/Smf involved in DNA uptake
VNDGARIVECAADILEELGFPAQAPTTDNGAAAPPPLLEHLAEGEAYDLDTLVELCGIAAPKLLPRLLELELAGWVRRVGGGRFGRAVRKMVT